MAIERQIDFGAISINKTATKNDAVSALDCRYRRCSRGSTVVPVCMRKAGNNGNHTGTMRRQPALLRTLPHCLIPSVPSDFTGTIGTIGTIIQRAAGAIEGPLLYVESFCSVSAITKNKTVILRDGTQNAFHPINRKVHTIVRYVHLNIRYLYPTFNARKKTAGETQNA